MKHLILYYLFALCELMCASAQNLILNGGFEINNLTSSQTEIDQSNVFDSLISGVFLIEGTLCLFTNDGAACVVPPQGNWMISDDNDYYWGAFGFILSQPLLAGHFYQLDFNEQSCIGDYGSRWIDIGLSNNPDQLGDIVAHVSQGFDSVWTNQQVTFIPTADKTFLTVKLLEEYAGLDAGLHADDFFLTDITTGIAQASSSSLLFFPSPTTATITLQLPLSKTSDIIVLNILGEEVMRQHISSPSSSIALNISSLARGAYFVVVRNEEEVFGGKFLKE